MKKFLTALFGLTALAAMLPAASSLTRETVITHLDSCEAILQEIQGNAKTAIPADILHRAKGLVIVNQFQAGFSVDGFWPAFWGALIVSLVSFVLTLLLHDELKRDRNRPRRRES